MAAPRDTSRDQRMLDALRAVAPGTAVREAIEDIIRGHAGALLVLADETCVSDVMGGGFRLDVPMSARLLYQLAKMDGAIVIDRDASMIRWANVHLVPDPALPTSESGTRHRSAERTARQCRALVVAVSASRKVVTLYLDDQRQLLESPRLLLMKVEQALHTLETYRMRLDQVSRRLLVRELHGSATLYDAVVVVQRAEMARRIVEEIERGQVELGTEGRLARMQLVELREGIVPDRDAVLRDYMVAPGERRRRRIALRMERIGIDELLQAELVASLLGYGAGINLIDTVVEPAGYRVLSRIPGLGREVIGRIVDRLGSLDAILEASTADIVEASGLDRARGAEVVEALRQLVDYFNRPSG